MRRSNLRVPADDDPAERIAALATELSSPVRVRVLVHLLREGEARFGELSQSLGVAESLLANHLGRMRDRGLLAVDKNGRTTTYRVSGPQLADTLQAVLRAIDDPVGEPAQHTGGRETPASEIVHARSCYDHLAGQLGVAVHRWFLARRALVPAGADADDLVLGDGAEHAFPLLGIGMTAVPTGRRRFAYACPDWTQGETHLGGALGAAVLSSFLDRGWLVRRTGSRALQVDPTGRAELDDLLATA